MRCFVGGCGLMVGWVLCAGLWILVYEFGCCYCGGFAWGLIHFCV